MLSGRTGNGEKQGRTGEEIERIQASQRTRRQRSQQRRDQTQSLPSTYQSESKRLRGASSSAGSRPPFSQGAARGANMPAVSVVASSAGGSRGSGRGAGRGTSRVGGFDLRMLHLGRLSFRRRKGDFENLPRGTYGTITVFDRWTNYAMVIVGDFCDSLHQWTALKSARRKKFSGNTFAVSEWFERLPKWVQERIREVGFSHFVDTLPRVQGGLCHLAYWHLWSSDGFHTYIPSIIRQDDDHADRFCCYHGIIVWGTHASRVGQAAAGPAGPNQDKFVQQLVVALRQAAGAVPQAPVTPASIPVRPPIEKLRKYGAVEFMGRKDDVASAAEYWLQSVERILEQMQCSPVDSLIEKYPWGDALDFPNFVQVAVVYQHRRLLLLGLFYDMCYLGERDIATARRGTAATNHLAGFVPSAYDVLVWTKLLVHIPPSTEFDPFAEVEELDRGQGAAPLLVSFFSFYSVLGFVLVSSIHKLCLSLVAAAAR
ncbi:hypothetical protein JCGZ_10790 [Jatropha curcas]|uniref:Aminotransferase-like plant mobile domain-containing protein n=1 Tax=Jatropha curcas TaxID=180498 RepID=A0A067LI34_JATCU|nr:hypothetical protein JCGZ_10790 [Jatropha curcas]